MMHPTTPGPRRHALIVGIDAYPKFPRENQLKGCVADAVMVASLLEDRFGFREPRLLLDGAATKAALLAALDDLVTAAGPGDVVVFHFSGHGSQVTDLEDDEPDGLDETIVPCDAGRDDPDDVLDITDDQLHHWLLRMTAVTPHVTLIIDSCQSGTILRDGCGAQARQLPAGKREVNLGIVAAAPTGPPGPSGWLHPSELGERYTLLAACRDTERAHEECFEGGQVHGALSWFLGQELMKARTGTTFRDLFETLAPRLTSAFPHQHPQLEGARDRELFGVRNLEPLRYFPVLERVDAGHVRLGAGAAFGISVGTELAVHPRGTKRPQEEALLGRLRVSEVEAVSALSEITEESSTGAVEAHTRAVVTAHDYGEMRLIVERPGALEDLEERELRQRVEDSPLLRFADRGERGQVVLYRIEARRTAEGSDPVPQLAALSEPRWVAVGRDGDVVLPTVRVAYPGGVARVVENLEARARYEMALRLENRHPESALVGRVGLSLARRLEDGTWVPLASGQGGFPVCEEGTRLGIDVTNRSEHGIYIAVLDFGLTGRVSLLHPVAGAEEPLQPGETLRVGVLDERCLRLRLPAEFSFDGDGAEGGTGFLKLFATTQPADFSSLIQRPYRDGEPVVGAHSPLGRLLQQAFFGRGLRGPVPVQESREQDWATVTRGFRLVPAPQTER